jgi:hypothetical protein
MQIDAVTMGAHQTESLQPRAGMLAETHRNPARVLPISFFAAAFAFL